MGQIVAYSDFIDQAFFLDKDNTVCMAVADFVKSYGIKDLVLEDNEKLREDVVDV